MSIVLTDKYVTTKKARQCSGCLCDISIGTRVRYMAGVNDGDFWSSYLCGDCVVISECDEFFECFEDGFYFEGDLKNCKTCDNVKKASDV